MSDEITINISARLVNGELDVTLPSKRLAINQNDVGYDANTFDLTTAVTSLEWAFTDGNPGYAFFTALTTGVEVGIGLVQGTTYLEFAKMKYGEQMVLRLLPGLGPTDYALRVLTNTPNELGKCRMDLFAD